MQVRLASINDLENLMLIYESARSRMVSEGNLTQWDNYNDFKDEIIAYINKEYLYVVTENDEVVGHFAYFYNEEVAYNIIDGKWLNNNKYVTIHKIASKYNTKGIGSFIIDYVINEIIKNSIHDIRIDTHKNNISMQKFLAKHGFIKCGIISLVLDFNNDRSLRLAYQLHIEK